MITQFALYMSLVVLGFFLHEVLHVVSAGRRLRGVKLTKLGVILFVEGVTVRDALLPQVVTAFYFLLGVIYWEIPLILVSFILALSSIVDFFAVAKLLKAKKKLTPCATT